jgi:hypothetical protein
MQKGNYELIPFINLDVKILNKIITSRIQQYKENLNYGQWGFSSENQG